MEASELVVANLFVSLRNLFAAAPRNRTCDLICLFTGCRVSEALALQTTDIKGGTRDF